MLANWAAMPRTVQCGCKASDQPGTGHRGLGSDGRAAEIRSNYPGESLDDVSSLWGYAECATAARSSANAASLTSVVLTFPTASDTWAAMRCGHWRGERNDAMLTSCNAHPAMLLCRASAKMTPHTKMASWPSTALAYVSHVQ
jgi:hypothetical protein